MSLGDLVSELHEKKTAAPAPKTELGGQVTPDGELKLDAADIDVVTARLKEVRVGMAALKKEEDQLKALLLAHPKAKAGFINSSIEIEGTQTIDLFHGPLLAALMEAKVFPQACNLTLSQPKVRALAAKHPKIAAEITTLHGRKIKTVK
jgi:hypothetical protein